LYKLDSLYPDKGNQGILDSLGHPHEPLYSAVTNYINPYIKAIDSTYLSLTWNNAYEIDPGSAMPSGVWLDTIYAVSDTPNPDLGWFHVGQFTGNNAKYIMLVNRACSQGENDSTAAPSITATVRFDPRALDWDYAYVIDLAATLRLAGADTGWVGIPETTYSAKMPDGTIPFTIVLGPGEGRLFMIVGTNEMELSGDIATQYNYQGRIQVEGDITVPADETMKILGPARFDGVFSGQVFLLNKFWAVVERRGHYSALPAIQQQSADGKM
jgi:hypothetical protein